MGIRKAALFLFLGAASVRAQEGVVVSSPVNIVPAGKVVPFKAVVDGPGHPACLWSLPEGEGHIDAEGVFTAPSLAESRLLKVRATCVADPEVYGEASVLVLRDDPAVTNMWQMVLETQGCETWNPLSIGVLPFLDMETGRRYHPEARVESARTPWPRARGQVLACAMPSTLMWDRRLAEADAALLSYREGGTLVRHLIRGRNTQTVNVARHVRESTVETLTCVDEQAGLWEGVVREVRFQVRGVIPFAGNPEAEPGHEDGAGLAARLRKPCGLAIVDDGPLGSGDCAVADPESHVIRLATREGQVRTLCGSSGVPGYADGAQARLHGPTFLAAKPGGAPEKWAIVIADSGNHAIRQVDAAGHVTTLAGGGEAGFVDSCDPSEARFSNPQGVATDAEGNVYVADAGNCAIRKIDLQGRVTTLAGDGQPGTRDGQGRQARFWKLRGLAAGQGALHVVDGHSVRNVSAGGQVTTILGVVDRPASRVGEPVFALSGGLAPALNNPCGIAGGRGRLLVADEGNHAIRVVTWDPLRPYAYTCMTLAGDPGSPATRWGLLRDGLPWTPGPEYAALGAPLGVAFDGSGGAYVSAGSVVAQLSQSESVPGQVRGLILQGPWDHPRRNPRAGRPFRMWFSSPAFDREIGQPYAHRWRMDRLDPATGEPVGTPMQGDSGAFLDPTILDVVFDRPGPVNVRLTTVTSAGVTFSFEGTLDVLPG